MDNDYRPKHNRLFHGEMAKQHKVVRWQKVEAPKNPFEAAASCRRPAKVPRTNVTPPTRDPVAREPESVLGTVPDNPTHTPVVLTCNSETMKTLSSCSVDHRKQSSSSKHVLRTIDTPYQPRDPKSFKDRGWKSRPFQPSWFDDEDWKTWLHYDQEKDAAFCFTCIKAVKDNLLSKRNAETAFISTGYKNWSDAATKGRGFDKHNRSESHREAHQRVHLIPRQCQDVGEQLSFAHLEEKSANRQALLKILSNVRFLARQALPLRGDGDGSNSNFTQLYLLREEDNPVLKKWRTEKKTDKYTHSTIQNEMMQIMALRILREVAGNIRKADFYAMMCDEATDAANTSQLVICLRWVDDDLVAHDEHIGLKDMADTSAESIVRELKDVLLRMNLKLNKCRGQCYDGCSTMSGHKNGVVVRIKEDEKRALYTHCYAHSLNLAVGDTMKTSKLLNDTIDTTFELTKLVKKSPKRDAKLKSIKNKIVPDCESDGDDDGDPFERLIKSPTIILFCPTRWTVRGDCLKGVIENYDELQELWDWSLDNVSDTEMKARIRGISSHTREFAYCFGIHLAATLLAHTDNLSKTLQAAQLSAMEAQNIARLTVLTLQSIRTDEHFDLFYAKVQKFAKDHGVSQPSLPRKRNASQKTMDSFCVSNSKSKSAPYHPETPQDDYRRKYYEALDLIIACVKNRFDQEDYEMYARCEQLLLKAVRKEDYSEELKAVTSFYGGDFKRDVLDTQLKTLPFVFSNLGDATTIYDLRVRVQELSKGAKLLISEVIKLLKLIIVMPATNAVSERSFSAMRRLHTYLRTNMSQNRLNHTMVLHVHKEKTDALSMVSIANHFIEGSEHRRSIFGKFEDVDLRSKTVPVKSCGVNVNLI